MKRCSGVPTVWWNGGGWNKCGSNGLCRPNSCGQLRGKSFLKYFQKTVQFSRWDLGGNIKLKKTNSWVLQADKKFLHKKICFVLGGDPGGRGCEQNWKKQKYISIHQKIHIHIQKQIHAKCLLETKLELFSNRNKAWASSSETQKPTTTGREEPLLDQLNEGLMRKVLADATLFARGVSPNCASG